MVEQVELAQIKKGLEMILDSGDLKERTVWRGQIPFYVSGENMTLMKDALGGFNRLPDSSKNEIYRELNTSETMIKSYARSLGLDG